MSIISENSEFDWRTWKIGKTRRNNERSSGKTGKAGKIYSIWTEQRENRESWKHKEFECEVQEKKGKRIEVERSIGKTEKQGILMVRKRNKENPGNWISGKLKKIANIEYLSSHNINSIIFINIKKFFKCIKKIGKMLSYWQIFNIVSIRARVMKLIKSLEKCMFFAWSSPMYFLVFFLGCDLRAAWSGVCLSWLTVCHSCKEKYLSM